jgi:hypothetical protein
LEQYMNGGEPGASGGLWGSGTERWLFFAYRVVD